MLQPTRTKVLLELQMIPEEKTKSGLVIIHKDAKMPKWGYVVAIGPHVSLPITLGDKIIYSNYAGIALNEDEKEYLLIEENECMAKMV